MSSVETGTGADCGCVTMGAGSMLSSILLTAQMGISSPEVVYEPINKCIHMLSQIPNRLLQN